MVPRTAKPFVVALALLAAATCAACGDDNAEPSTGGDTGTGVDAYFPFDGGIAKDAGRDAAVHPDAGTDAGADAAHDGGRDAGTDSGHDTGVPDGAVADAGEDAGETDAGVDGGSGDGGTGATTLIFIKQPKDTPAGKAIANVEIVVRDANGRVATSADNPVTIAIKNNPSGGTLTGTLTQTPVGGYADFADLSIDKVGAGYTLEVTSPGLAGADSKAFTITAGDAARIAFTVQPTGAVAGAAIAPAVQVAVQDSAGYTVTTATDSITIAIADNPAGGTLSGTLTAKAVAGVATFGNLTIDKAGAGYTLKATSGSLADAASAAFDVTAGAAARLGFLTWINVNHVGTPLTPPVQVGVQDQFGNTVTTATDTITVSFKTSMSGSNLTGTLQRNAVAGVATFDDLVIDKVGTGYTLKADAGALAEAVSPTFDVTAGPAAKIAFTVQPGNTVAGVAIAPAVKVEVQDSLGNTVATATDAVTVAIGINPAGGTLDGTLTVNAVAGVAAFGDLSIAKAGAGYTLTAASGSLTGATSAAFDIAPAAATKVAFAVQPGNATAGTALAPAVKVAIEDALGNVVTAATDNVTVAIGANPGGGTLSGAKTVASVAGVATFGDLSIEKAGTGYTLTASSGALTGATSTAFDITPAAAAKVVFTVQPTSTTAGSSLSPAVKAAIEDSLGNVVTTAADNVTVAIGANPGGGTLSGTKTVAAVAGVATFGDLSIDKVGIGYTLAASSGSLAGATSAAFDISPGAAAKVAFVAQPTAATAGAVISPAVKVAVHDASGNLVSTATNSITILIANNPGGGTLVGTIPANAVAGVATFSDLAINKAGIGYTLAAQAAGLTGTISAAFDINPASAVKLGFVVQPSNTEAGAAISPAVQVAVQDVYGNTVTSRTDAVTVAFWTNPGGAALGGTLTRNAAGGYAAFDNLTITKAALGYSFSASAGGLTAATSALFDIAPAGVAGVSFKTQPSNAEAGATISPAVEASLLDQYGNLVTNATGAATISIATGPGGATLYGTLSRTPVAGVVAWDDLSIRKAGAYTLLASAGVSATATSGSFDISAAGPSAAESSITGTEPVTADGVSTSTITVTAKDTYGNAVSGQTVQISATGTANTYGQPGLTNGSGVATGTLASTKAESKTLHMVINPGPNQVEKDGSTVTFVAGSATSLAFSVQPSTVTMKQPISPAVVVTAYDAWGNVATTYASAVTASLDAASPPGNLGGTLTVTASSGVATFDDIWVDQTGSGFMLDADDTVLATAVSDAFDVYDTPEPGDFIITEIMHSPTAVADSVGQWFEIRNLTGRLMDVVGTTIDETGGGGSFTVAGDHMLVPGDGYFVFGASADPTQNGGATVDYEWPAGFGLSTQDTLTLAYAALTIDSLAWDNVAFPHAAGAAMNLSSLIMSAYKGHRRPWYWCDATDAYGDGDLGTPGADNADCGIAVVPPINWCAIQFPDTIPRLDVKKDVTIFVQAWEPDMTTRNTAGNDYYPWSRAQLGWGPPGSDPSLATSGWTWVNVDYNDAYGPGSPGFHPNNDEAMGTMNIGKVGNFIYGFRIALLDPVTHVPGPPVYCDQTHIATPPSTGTYGTVTVVPVVTSASPAPISLNAKLVLDGRGFTGTAHAVTIGGQAQGFTVDSDTQITIGGVDPATPLGTDDIVVTVDGFASDPYPITVTSP